jgi:large subunit ribosomal protein L18
LAGKVTLESQAKPDDSRRKKLERVVAMNKKDARVRRARKTRARIAEQRANRLVVSRSNCHIYAQIVAPSGDRILTSASTLEGDVRKDLKNGGNKAAAAVVGKRIAEKAKQLGIDAVAFDRSGFKYHGRVKALADAAREGGLKF